MSKLYVKTTEALKSLRRDQAGVVSFEYIIVAACVVAAVAAVFGAGATPGIQGALSDGLAAVVSSFRTAAGV